MKLPRQETTTLHDFTYKILCRFVDNLDGSSFCMIVFNSQQFLGDLRLSRLMPEHKAAFWDMKDMGYSKAQRFEAAC